MSEDFSGFDALSEALTGENVQEVVIGSEPPAPSLENVKAVLTRASEITEVDPDQGDFTPDGAYKGFPIIPDRRLQGGLPVQHQFLPHRFYVQSPLGAVGLVPWVGSKIVWPWERGWVQDLHAEKVESLLRPEPKGKKK